MQRTEEWFRQRRGKLTASALGQATGLVPWGSPNALAVALRKDAMPKDVDKPAAARATAGPLAWGTDNEPNGLLEYMIVSGETVEDTGFWRHPHLDWFGGSPDGLVGTEGLVEIKCPYTRKCYEAIPPYYYCQVNALMEITGREWCDLCVWTPSAVKTWRIRANKSAFDTLLPHYTAFWACVCNGSKPPNPSAKLLPLVQGWIAQDSLLMDTFASPSGAFEPRTDGADDAE